MSGAEREMNNSETNKPSAALPRNDGTLDMSGREDIKILLTLKILPTRPVFIRFIGDFPFGFQPTIHVGHFRDFLPAPKVYKSFFQSL